MKPIPVVFHIGPLQVHTYGLGLALTFWFAFTYFERRLHKNGYRTVWWVSVFLWTVLAAIVGARTFHVLSMFGYYSHHPGQVVAVWQGGLSSFGGLIFAGIRMMSGRFQDAIPGLFGALFGAGVLGWGAGWIGSLTGQSM